MEEYRAGESPSPASNDIASVAQSCCCKNDEAFDLLKRANNDIGKAIRLHKILTEYKRDIPRNLPQTCSPSPPQSIASGRCSNHAGHSDSYQEAISVPTESSISWDFVLPVVYPYSADLRVIIDNIHEPFNLRELIAVIQFGATVQTVMQYINRYDVQTVEKHINDLVDGFPAVFYVVETNKEDLLRLWASYGANIFATHQPSGVPLLAYAIMHSDNIQADTTLMTATLLSLGASPNIIPSAFYSPYLQDLPEQGPREEQLGDLDDQQKRWCTSVAQGKLARGCSLSQRYHLDRAAQIQGPSRRQQQVAKIKRAEPLLGVPYFLIGQNHAAGALLEMLLAHLLEPSKKPLVLVFAGPSGHGKTEMAKCLGHLLSLKLHVVDCTIVNREMELFGPRHPYVGAEKGSPLNNFLAENNNKASIVFLDEFEKTTSEIHKALLLPFDNGEYQDRRELRMVNCFKTIWILASNAHDSIIQDFTDVHSQTLLSDNVGKADVKRLTGQLSAEIREDFRAHHGAPLTGRISKFIPFLPFSLGEQAVIVHKALLELSRSVRMPVNLQPGQDEKLLGNIKLSIRRDASVCRILALSEYHQALGARSLNTAADKIKGLLVREYLSIDAEIVENDEQTEFIIDVQEEEVVVNRVHRRSH